MADEGEEAVGATGRVEGLGDRGGVPVAGDQGRDVDEGEDVRTGHGGAVSARRGRRAARPPRHRAAGPLAVEDAAHEGRADDHAVGDGGRLDRLLGGGDAEAHEHRQVGERPSPAWPGSRALLAERCPLAGDAHEVDAVDEAAALLGARGRRRSSGVIGPASSTVSMPAASAAGAHAPCSSRGTSGRITPEMPASASLAGEALVARCGTRGCSRSSPRAGRRRRRRASVGEDRHRGGAALRRARSDACLDDGAVHRRVGERDADLDGVGTGVGHGPAGGRSSRAEPAGDVGDEQLAAAVSHRPQVRLEEPCDAVDAVTRSRSPGGSPHLRHVLVAAAREVDAARSGRRARRLPDHPGQGVGRLEGRDDALGAGEHAEGVDAPRRR